MKYFKLLKKYSSMKWNLYIINHISLMKNNGKRLILKLGENLSPDEIIKLIKKENLYYKNLNRKENVYISPIKEQKFNIVFIDDLQDIDRFKKKNNFMLIKTSKHKYQGYFLLDKYVDYETAYKIQKFLCEIYKGDIGALSPIHLRRIPEFLNTKYSPPFKISIFYVGNNVISVNTILSIIERNENKKNKEIKRLKNKNIIKKTWEDFKDTDDLSVVDMKYTCYLLRIGLEDNEIYQRLLTESPDIHKRHKIDDYIPRTIEKAKSYLYIEDYNYDLD